MTSATISYTERLTETVPAVRESINDAAHAAGRNVEEVRLVAVTKGHPFEAVDAALAAGLTDLGENRVAEMEEKVAHYGSESVVWHMIGHIQSRKAGRVAEAAAMVHSVDSLKLARKLSRAAEEGSAPLNVLVQMNTSGEEAKYGFAPEEGYDAVLEMSEMTGLNVRGLMTMAPFDDDEGVLGSTFSGLRKLSERLQSASEQVGPELSMGMTNDLDIAIREGSTIVRIGTALFGERDRK
ncbi:MAG: YggS family pyridoxal phosphate-dependent enzyme [Gemmatimonadetes bacterium]|nr:YggS family pyridoxal phosphate-dependent enzyme [Gemmatimonadota bacterium]NNL30999.1 YggS family pyridoxal phosphate-dependent enzyme [Gemmatimonadota bacterium]